MSRSIEMILNDFSLLDEWEDRYRYIIELGKELEPLSVEEHNDATRVTGCASQVWLVFSTKMDGGKTRFLFRSDSDALIVKGLLAIVMALYNQKTRDEILSIKTENIFKQLELTSHLSQQRSNGLNSIISRICHIAAASA